MYEYHETGVASRDHAVHHTTSKMEREETHNASGTIIR